MVIGQEQDKKGEGFNPAESFVGSISQLNLWDYVLSPQQVNSIFSVKDKGIQREGRKTRVLWKHGNHGKNMRHKRGSLSILLSDYVRE